MKLYYNHPVFMEIVIDNEITLVMMTGSGSGEIPGNPQFDTKEQDKNEDDPFKSPFEE